MISKVITKKTLTFLTLILGLSFIGLPSATMAGKGTECHKKCHGQGGGKQAYEACKKNCMAGK